LRNPRRSAVPINFEREGVIHKSCRLTSVFTNRRAEDSRLRLV
jgi:hypothetical protein